jgi:hypothetical protein
MADKPTKVKSPRTGKLTDVNEMDTDELTEYCAWNTQSELDMLWRFLVEKKLSTEADTWLRNKAIEEIKEGL